MIIHDGLIIVYLASRLDDDSRPAQMCEITAPGVKRMPWMGHIEAVNKALNDHAGRLDAVERALGNLGEDADLTLILARLTELENLRGRIREALE
jgi:hypothetical protein